jgi:hypothetical protein
LRAGVRRAFGEPDFEEPDFEEPDFEEPDFAVRFLPAAGASV